jgi:hypothetical protein
MTARSRSFTIMRETAPSITDLFGARTDECAPIEPAHYRENFYRHMASTGRAYTRRNPPPQELAPILASYFRELDARADVARGARVSRLSTPPFRGA